MSTIKNTVIGAAMMYLLLRFSISTAQEKHIESLRLTDELLKKLRRNP